MARKFTVSLDLNKNELLNARIQNLSSNPSLPVVGQIYYNTVDNEVRFYDGTQWVAGSSVEFGDTSSRPAASKAGQLYVDTQDTIIYVDNGTSWVQGTITLNQINDAIDLHAQDTSTHGVSGDIVGTSDTQTLSNKTISDNLRFNTGGGNVGYISDDEGTNLAVAATTNNLNLSASQDINLTTNSGNIIFNPDGVVNIDSQINVFGNLNTTTIAGQSLNSADGSLTIQDGNADSQIHINGVSKNIELLPRSGSKAFYGSAATAGNEIAKISDIQASSSGLSWKTAVNLLDSSTTDWSSFLTGSYTTLPDIDSHETLTIADIGYRILLTGQTGSGNGIYEVVSGDESGIKIARSSDADSFNELIGAAVFVMEGTTYGSTSWVQSNHYITDFAGQDWIQFSGQGTYIGSDSIQVDGNQINALVDNTRGIYIDGDGIYLSTGLGTQFGIGGAIEVNAGTGFDTSSGVLQFASGYGVRKYTATIGNNSAKSFTLNHAFDTRHVTVQIFESGTPYAQVEADVQHTDTNNVTIKFAIAPGVGEYEVVIVG